MQHFSAPQSTQQSVVLISERFGYSGGGEAIKAQQYATRLMAQGVDVRVITAERSKEWHGAVLPDDNLWLVEDSFLQRLMWRLPPLRPLLGVHFQWRARGIILREFGRTSTPIFHYISPVSPVALRFPVKGNRNILGPLTGNIYYPKGFRDRMSASYKLREAFHGVAQRLFGKLLGDKKNFEVFLVSGYERTRASLRMAGCEDSKMKDVVDSGVSEKIVGQPRIKHEGRNTKFLCSGRLIDHKGIDLAIRAVAQAGPLVTLDIFGDGDERPKLEALVTSLGLGARVSFKGWLANHDDLTAQFPLYRGYILPSLAEANGIVMQEAMMAGLPVVALRWGGPERLADEDSAIYVHPTNQDQVVNDLAMAMDSLAADGAYADRLSMNGRKTAEENFTWERVAASWQASYEDSTVTPL